MTPTVAFGGILVVLALVWLARAIPILREARASRTWATTTATVLHRDTRVTGRGSEAVVIPVVRYRYVVDGLAYESERITVADGGFGNPEVASRVLARYASDTVVVRFNPTRPAQAVLSSDLPTYMSTVLGLGLAMLLAGVGFILFGTS